MTNSEIVIRLEKLTDAISRVAIPIPAIPPIPPIPPIPAIPPVVYTGDHDLLVKLDTKVEGLIMSVGNLSTKGDLEGHEKDDLVRHAAEDKIIEDHELRVRANTLNIEQINTQLKTWGVAVVFIMAVLTLVTHFWK